MTECAVIRTMNTAPIIRTRAAWMTTGMPSRSRWLWAAPQMLLIKLGLPPLRHLNLEGLRELLIGVGDGLIGEPQMPQDSLDGCAHVQDLHHLDPYVQTLIKNLARNHQLLF